MGVHIGYTTYLHHTITKYFYKIIGMVPICGGYYMVCSRYFST